MSDYTIQRQQKIDGIEKFEAYVKKLISGDLARFTQYLPSLDTQIEKNKHSRKSKKPIQPIENIRSSKDALIDSEKPSIIESTIDELLNKLKYSINQNLQKSKGKKI